MIFTASVANTSTDNVHFETDARYSYYKHGPLARTEIGRLYVQGVDYIYTLQGWLKGVNSTSVNTSRDPGKDGYTSGNNRYVAADEYGFSLRYFKGDYSPINLAISAANYFDVKQTSTSLASASPDLFNGNISNMVTGIGQLAQPTLARAFKYDQLNRISEALSFTSPNYTTNEWGTSQASDSSWYESFSYDANGNITKLKRKGNNSSHYMMDNFKYNYLSETNKLTSVDDQVTSSNYTIDIDDQSSNNYKYDHIGNLTVDVAEGIDSIQWNVYGKIRSITRTETAYEDLKKANLNFTYTPDGHRSTKGVAEYLKETEFSYYVRDAQGNVMAVYEMNNTKLLDSSQLTVANINTALIGTSSVEMFADFMIEEVDIIGSTVDLAGSYTDEVVSESKVDEVLLAFDPANYIVNEVSGIQADVLLNYSATTILQSISNYQGFSTFLTNIMVGTGGACSDAQITGFLESAAGLSTLLNNWNGLTVVSMGNAYRSWLITNSYLLSGYPTCSNLGDVQTMASTQPGGVFGQFIAASSTYHTAFKNAVNNSMLSGDIISQLAGGTNIRTIIDARFTPTVKFYALRNNGSATLWGNIIAEYIGDVRDHLEYYETDSTQNYVHQCIIVLPSFVDSYIGGTVSNYLQKIRNYYTTENYITLIKALTESYFTATQTFQLAEWHIYGSSRVGIYKANKPLKYIVDETVTSYTYQTRVKERYNGKKQYELSNHLGNVLVTISDRRTAICNEVDSTLRYEAVVVTATDFYSFGSPLIGRSYQADTLTGYRFAMNTQEKDDEIYGKGNASSAEFWEYDTRIGRRWNLDVKPTIGVSYYSCFYNNPIYFTDINGDIPKGPTTAQVKDGLKKLGNWMTLRGYKNRVNEFAKDNNIDAKYIQWDTKNRSATITKTWCTTKMLNNDGEDKETVPFVVTGTYHDLTVRFSSKIGESDFMVYTNSEMSKDQAKGAARMAGTNASIDLMSQWAANAVATAMSGLSPSSMARTAITEGTVASNSKALVLNASENAAAKGISAGENALVKTLQYDIPGHGAERLAERGITEKMAQTAISSGSKFFDPKNGTINYILEGGFSSGKDLLIGTNQINGAIKTGIKGTNLVRPRMIQIK
jgi:hypothetical protein